MHATVEATASHTIKFPDLHFNVLGRTGLHVSGAGFGGYRVSIGVETHRRALEHALLSGINVIDTSTNYADGGSEQLIGETLLELARTGLIERRAIVTVTKAGYIQGSNYQMARERRDAGGGFPEVVEYGEGLWHCIAPEFLEDQLTRSLERLNMTTVDVLLLHNPEYYLGWAAQNGVALAEARAEYYRRIRSAFQYLETEVDRGRILWYGVSSNTLPQEPDSAEFTSLEEITRIAEEISPEHHFGVIQFPANLYESQFVIEPTQSLGRTLMEVARTKDLGVLINRPLNAIVDGGLVRLADLGSSAVDSGEEGIDSAIEHITATEQQLSASIIASLDDADQTTIAVSEFMTVGPTMAQHWRSLGSIEQFNEIISQHFAPRLGYLGQLLRERDAAEQAAAYTSYLADVRGLFEQLSSYYGRHARERAGQIRTAIAAAVEQPVDGPLSTLAVRMLLGIEGLDTVLVGMRREPYVDAIIAALRSGPLGDESAWWRLQLPDPFEERAEPETSMDDESEPI
ncbi:MAG TPA: aldo/keto reductase [Candidatus Kapabacteria bacterium]|nr:aldo/keto reductase [Candidatus Kapabacteria bacterium]